MPWDFSSETRRCCKGDRCGGRAQESAPAGRVLQVVPAEVILQSEPAVVTSADPPADHGNGLDNLYHFGVLNTELHPAPSLLGYQPESGSRPKRSLGMATGGRLE